MTSAERLVRGLSARGLRVALAESCTAGLAADALAQIPGASRVLWGSFVCYTVEAKAAMLGLDPGALEKSGAVSEETARALALGALEKSGADLAAAVTGLAGPEGDGSGQPVGTVWIACARRGGEAQARRFQYSGDRNEVRRAAAREVLGMLAIYMEE